jgi:hypothetical protein
MSELVKQLAAGKVPELPFTVKLDRDSLNRLAITVVLVFATCLIIWKLSQRF